MIIYDESFTDYRLARCVSFHSLSVFRHCPLLYYKTYVERSISSGHDTEAMAIGRAAHCLILEGDAVFSAEYEEVPQGVDRRSKVGIQWYKDLESTGKTALKGKDYQLITRMAEAVEGNIQARLILNAGKPEVVIRRKMYNNEIPLPIQTRMDWLRPDLDIADLKTCDDLNHFPYDIEKRGYYRQAAYYLQALRGELGAPADLASFRFIAVEKDEPFRVGVWKCDSELLAIADQENEAVLRDLAEAFRTNYWPGSPTDEQLATPSDYLRQKFHPQTVMKPFENEKDYSHG